MSATRPRVVIVDTGSGNLRSVEKAVSVAGGQAQVSSDPGAVAAADKVVVPGQGAFGRCIAGLSREGGGLRQAVLEAIGAGKGYLGICLGLQVLFEGSDEQPDCAGLGVLPGKVARFEVGAPLKVPHMGWNACERGPAGAAAHALQDTPDGAYFYFVHSYYPAPAREADVALWSDHGGRFCAAVARDNVFACQFHPEKSQAAGLSLLRRFLSA
jgi:imidazole glycerol-phosphate synthase subunit HisH